MRRHEIESWALNIIDRAELKQPIEDSRVELKAEWPNDIKRAARRIAGHANAAHGEAILWIIGVNEQTGEIPGAPFSEFASWYNSIRAEFDELAPEPISLNIPVRGVTVTALFFETDEAPFVIKNSAGGTIQREVPWREATGIRSATRAQLIRLLSPLQKLPSVEVVASLLRLRSWKAENGSEYLSCGLFLALFITQHAQQETVFPSHRCEAVFSFPTLEPLRTGNVQFYDCGGKGVSASHSFLSIRSSGLFEARTDPSFEMQYASKLLQDNRIFERDIVVNVTLYSATAERSLKLDLKFEGQGSFDSQAQARRWQTGWYTFVERFR